ncbi:MAG: DUF3987 domain-containing protein, partial [Rhabdochlamydiaceae bacterium]|nr:DUF3987 domain-containing protein [Rhabdochlamydiaceae bacterium]
MNQTSLQDQRGPHVPPCRPLTANQGSYVQNFSQAMCRAGLSFNEDIIADGAIHRFPTGKKDSKDGWYVFYGMAGAFGDWSCDLHEKWSLKEEILPSPEKEKLHIQIEKSKRIAEKERQTKHEKTALTALEKWNAFSEQGHSSYLGRKKINGFGIRFHKDLLIIPMKDTAGKLWSLQRISGDGTKRFLPGGRKKSCFHSMGVLEDGKTFLITEGYATGASIYMATQQATVIAFDVGNLEPVIAELKKAYPKSPFIIAGDDDRWKEMNTGRTTAEQVAQKHGCPVIFPVFKNTDTKPTDFNDLHVLEGLSVVKEQLKQVLQSIEWPEPTPLNAIKNELSPVVSLPPALIPEPYQDWLIDIAERMQCPLDYVAVGSLIVTASLIGTGCGIRPKARDSWTVIPNLWGGIIGAPSTLKSPALKEILR